MKAFILGSKNRYAYCPNRRVDRTQVAKIEGNRANHAQIGKREASAIAHPLIRLGQSPRKIGKFEHKLPYTVTSAMAGSISRENAQPGLGRRRNSLIHQAGKIRPNARSVRPCLEISEKPELRETTARRRG